MAWIDPVIETLPDEAWVHRYGAMLSLLFGGGVCVFLIHVNREVKNSNDDT